MKYKEKEHSSSSEIKFISLLDIFIILVCSVLIRVKNTYIDINSEVLINNYSTVIILSTILGIIGWFIITLFCGSHQTKADGDKVNIATVINKKTSIPV